MITKIDEDTLKVNDVDKLIETLDELRPKAKEMFDVLGFRVLEDTERYLRYIKTEDEEIKLYSWGQIVDFDKRDKTIRVRSQKKNNNLRYFNVDELTAINKQIEELGW